MLPGPQVCYLTTVQRSMPTHLFLSIPEGWSNEQKGSFFESFVAELLKPMRFIVEKQLRVTGLEIDLLAKSQDQPRRILVECKAQREALPAEVITKLLGNVQVRSADEGWLFSLSDLSKDGRGMWDEIQQNPKLSKKFTWYPPKKILEILIQQDVIVSNEKLNRELGSATVGDATLIWSPTRRAWLFELLEQGLPVYYSVFDATTGHPLSESDAAVVAKASERFSSLKFRNATIASAKRNAPRVSTRSPVARVVGGDTWDDLRPARPIDFVGRDELIQEISQFLEAVRTGATSTRTFAVQGPSGWGKSSLVLKLADMAAKRRRIPQCSFTAIDTRSATSTSFVSNALQLALGDAAGAKLATSAGDIKIGSLSFPLDSADVSRMIQDLVHRKAVAVLVFDQFEELFTKESLFETFNAIRDLSLDLDAKQVPIVLGFAWKTDVSLPQQHPAYHLWHELADRRRDFKMRQFGTPDIVRVVSRAEQEIGAKLSPALRARLVEQCQGYPWLLKKLLVHVGKRLRTTTSQYTLLERELEVEVLFKEDVAGLKQEQLRCLKYVAERAPAYVSDVEEHFKPEITNSLLSKRLLVRSGLNYVIYWDIFRDFLLDNRVPQIPWARTFQRDPRSAVLAAQIVQKEGKTSAGRVGRRMGGTERGSLNVLSDLVALQIVDRVGEDQYKLATHVKSTDAHDIAELVHGQLARHVVCRELAVYDRNERIGMEALEAIVRTMKPGGGLSEKVVHQYAGNLKRWLLFAGHLEERQGYMYRPMSIGLQKGLLSHRRGGASKFLGGGTPEGLVQLLQRLMSTRRAIRESVLLQQGLRNALYDAKALQLVERRSNETVVLSVSFQDLEALLSVAKQTIIAQRSTQVIASALAQQPDMSIAELGEELRSELQAGWKSTSARRYANGIRTYLVWAEE